MYVAESVESWWKPLVEARPGLHLSLFLPMSRGGISRQANWNRWRQGLRMAELQLVEAGADERQRAELMAGVSRWDRMDRPPSESADGLAYLAAPGFHRLLPTPFPLAEAVHVGAQFHLRPLLPLSHATEHFYVVALSLHEVRLLEASPFAVRRVELPMAELDRILGAAHRHESQRQLHTASPPALGERAAIPHAHGAAADEFAERELEHRLRRLWEWLAPHLTHRRAPVVLAAVEEHLAPVRRAFRDARLVAECVAGSPDRLSDEELWRRALPVLEAYREHELARQFAGANSGGRPPFVAGLGSVLPAAVSGRVARLLVGEHLERWGRFDERQGQVEERPSPAPGDEDLVELAVYATLARGGVVDALPAERLPGGAAAAAWLRY